MIVAARRPVPDSGKRQGRTAPEPARVAPRKVLSRFRPRESQTTPGFAGPPSFLRLPVVAPPAVPQVDVVISGVPFDGGTSHRPGARFGPHAVREASALAQSFSAALGVDIFDELSAADGGDIVSSTRGLAGHLTTLAERAHQIACSGVIGGYVGGDQTVTLGALRGIQRAKHKPLALLHFDAHPDGSPRSSAEGEIHHRSVIANAIGEGLVRPDATLQIGLRGPYAAADDAAFGPSRRVAVAGIDEVRWDLRAVVGQVRELASRGLLYVSVDVSVLDPSAAPGTGWPSPGGMNVWELQQLLRALVGADIIGFDVVEIAPAYDPANVTSLIGVTVLQEILAAIADTRRSARPAPSTRRASSRGRKLSP